MGIEIPESFGGAGGTFFHSVLAVEELSRVDPSIGVLVDVQNTLVINAFLRWGSDDLKRRNLPKLASGLGGSLRAVGVGLGQRRVRAATRARQCRTRRRRVRAHRSQAVDHQRERGGHLSRLRHSESRGRLSGDHRVCRRARIRRLHRRQERRQARHPRQQHLRADPRRLSSAASQGTR